MAVVALIPTGVMEHRALGHALATVFPGHAFVARPPERHADGFTSRDVAPLAGAQPGPVPTNLDELAAELVNAIFPGRRGQRIDFAYLVEDLELCNQDQPELVLGLFRNAVDKYIRQTWPQQSDRIYTEVRERCSFHLFRPVTETYFFGDAAALQRAGVSRPHQLPADLDVEHFRTLDPEFLALPAGTSQIADMPDREFHPKCYLRYLCDPTLMDKRKRYRETGQGVAALESARLVRCTRSVTSRPVSPCIPGRSRGSTEQSAPVRQLGSCRPASAIPGAEEPGPAESLTRFQRVALGDASRPRNGRPSTRRVTPDP